MYKTAPNMAARMQRPVRVRKAAFAIALLKSCVRAGNHCELPVHQLVWPGPGKSCTHGGGAIDEKTLDHHADEASR